MGKHEGSGMAQEELEVHGRVSGWRKRQISNLVNEDIMGFRSRGQMVMDDHYATERMRSEMASFLYSVLEDSYHLKYDDLYQYFSDMWEEAGTDLIEEVWFDVLEKMEEK